MPQVRVGHDGTGTHEGKTYTFPGSLAGALVTVTDDDPAPVRSASKAEWVAYAVASGADETEANEATKEQLIEAWG